MKWYGSNNFNNSVINNKKHYLNKKTKTILFFINKKININTFKLQLYIPFNWNFILLKKNKNLSNIYIYSTDYYYIIPINTCLLFFKFDKHINTIMFNFLFKNNFNPIFWNYCKTLFFSFSKIFFLKLKFKGKGYYIYKNIRNTIALQFGYSHLFYLYSFFITIKFLSKTTILLFGINKLDLIKNSKLLYHIKNINIFTSKGIRFSRQIIYKKTGKISSYR